MTAQSPPPPPPSTIRLPFQRRWRPAVLAGTKTTTVRTKRYGQPGDTFEVEGVPFVLTEVVAMPLGRIRDTLWRDEGMTSPEEFEEVWRENHPTRGFAPHETAWVHRFRRVGPPDA